MTEHTKSIKMYGPRDYAAIVDGEPVSYHATAIAAKAAADTYVYDLIEMEAREADMAHDVQQAATDSDVAAALAEPCYCAAPMMICPGCGAEQVCSQDGGCINAVCLTCSRERPADAPLAFNRTLEPLPDYPAFLYYDRNAGGIVYAGSNTAYPSYIEAALARDGK